MDAYTLQTRKNSENTILLQELINLSKSNNVQHLKNKSVWAAAEVCSTGPKEIAKRLLDLPQFSSFLTTWLGQDKNKKMNILSTSSGYWCWHSNHSGSYLHDMHIKKSISSDMISSISKVGNTGRTPTDLWTVHQRVLVNQILQDYYKLISVSFMYVCVVENGEMLFFFSFFFPNNSLIDNSLSE